MDFDAAVRELQRGLATIDLLTRPPRRGRQHVTEFLVLKLGDLKVKMYQEPGHALPHVHVDYGPKNHEPVPEVWTPKKSIAGLFAQRD
jgi:hypothetical protein